VLPAPVSQTPTTDNNWFTQQATPQVPSAAPGQTQAAQMTSGADDAAISSQLRARSQAQDVVYDHMKTIQPIGQQSQQSPAPTPAPKQLDDTAKQLAANNDLNISTIARVASKKDLPSDEEVIIPLH